MSKVQPNFRQNDISRAIRAAKRGGLEIESVVIDAAVNRITLMIRGETSGIPVETKRQGDRNDNQAAGLHADA